MRKYLLSVLCAFFVLSCSCDLSFAGSSGDKVPGFKDSWVNPEADFRKYTVIYLGRLDLGQVKVDISDLQLDDEEDGTSYTERDVLRDLDYDMRERFGRIVGRVMPVALEKGDLGEGAVLACGFKLTGTIRDTGLLMNSFFDEYGRATEVSMLFEAWDYGTGEKLITLSDLYVSPAPERDASFFDTNDQDEWDRAMDKWAKSLSFFFAERRRPR